MTTVTDTRDWLEGIDHDDAPIHLHCPNTEPKLSYCGILLTAGGATYIPSEEWDEPDVCPVCLAREAVLS